MDERNENRDEPQASQAARAKPTRLRPSERLAQLTDADRERLIEKFPGPFARHKERCTCNMCWTFRLKVAERPHDDPREFLREARRKVFVKALTTPGAPTFASISESARLAGVSPQTGSDMLRESGTRRMVAAALAARGIARDSLASKLAEGLNATETKFFSFEGRVTDKRKVKDYFARYKFLELAHRLLGDLEKGEEAEASGPRLVIIASRVEVEGHNEACACEECERRREKFIEEQLAISATNRKKFEEKYGPLGDSLKKM
jgi:hypothetical protein